MKLRSLSLAEWLIYSIPMFLIGFGLGLYETYVSWWYWVFIVGLILEIPSLIAVYRHKKE